MTTPTKADTDYATRYAEWLAGFAERDDRAALAALRRGLGKQAGTVPEMYRIVEAMLGAEASTEQIETSYAVGSLFGLLPDHQLREGHWARRGLGTSLRAIRLREGTTDEDEGVARRFVAVLDAERATLPQHLRGLLSLYKSRAGEQASIDFAQLYRDIRGWERFDRRVQRNWAAGFWGPGERKDGDSAGDEGDTPAINDNDDQEG